MTTEAALRARVRVGPDGQVDLLDFLHALAEVAAQSGREVDWIAAGDLIHHGWTTLREASDATLARYTPTEPTPPPAPDPNAFWARLNANAWLQRINPARAFHAALDAGGIALEHKPRRPPLPRRANLDDLLNALRAAEADAAAHAAAREQARAYRERRQAAAEASVQAEDPARDLEDVRARLPTDGREVRLKDLAPGWRREDLVTALQGTLVLVRDGSVRAEQDFFPFGEIRVRRTGARRP